MNEPCQGGFHRYPVNTYPKQAFKHFLQCRIYKQSTTLKPLRFTMRLEFQTER